MQYNENNIFAKILRGELSCKKICENDFYLAFYDIHPKAALHALIIPKGAYFDALDFHNNAKADEIVGFYKGIGEVITFLDIKDGYRLLSNSGINGGQEVPHYHVHLLANQKLNPL